VRSMQRLQVEGVACAAIDITAIGSQSPTQEQWYAGVARQLLSGLGMTDQIALRSWWKEREFLPPVDRLGALIEALLALIPGNVAIFVDEIDSVLSLNFGIDDFFGTGDCDKHTKQFNNSIDKMSGFKQHFNCIIDGKSSHRVC
jgi:hypothetical protein